MANTFNKKIAVFGTGSWGTALAIVLARNGFGVNLWGFFEAEVNSIKKNRINLRYLPDIKLPENISLYTDVADALRDIDDTLLVVPSNVFHSTLELIKPYITRNTRIAWGTKGFDCTDRLLHEAVKEVLGEIAMAVISGPTFAREVALGLPTAVTIASNDQVFSKDLSNFFHSETFRVYTSSDLIGVQIGGAVKNVLAIAIGIADGMGFGANARAALITRGLAELTRLGIAFGGKMETFMGLTGIGDLVLTCTDNQSRNRRFGLNIGQGMDRNSAEKAIDQVVEGIVNAELIHLVTQKLGIEMPISLQVYRILYENLSPKDAVVELLARERKSEI